MKTRQTNKRQHEFPKYHHFIFTVGVRVIVCIRLYTFFFPPLMSPFVPFNETTFVVDPFTHRLCQSVSPPPMCIVSARRTCMKTNRALRDLNPAKTAKRHLPYLTCLLEKNDLLTLLTLLTLSDRALTGRNTSLT